MIAFWLYYIATIAVCLKICTFNTREYIVISKYVIEPSKPGTTCTNHLNAWRICTCNPCTCYYIIMRIFASSGPLKLSHRSVWARRLARYEQVCSNTERNEHITCYTHTAVQQKLPATAGRRCICGVFAEWQPNNSASPAANMLHPHAAYIVLFVPLTQP